MSKNNNNNLMLFGCVIDDQKNVQMTIFKNDNTIIEKKIYLFTDGEVNNFNWTDCLIISYSSTMN